jgi:hypothetical protein
MIWHLRYAGKISVNHFALRKQDTGGTRSVLGTNNRLGHTAHKDYKRKNNQ